MSSHSSHSKVLHKHANAGFGLIELMVSIGIMVLVSAVVIVRQNSFNGAVLLRGEAYDVAFSVREAQLNAVSAVGSGGATTYRSRVGVYFDTGSLSYPTFKDSATGNGFYEAAEGYGQPGMLDSRFEIGQIRADGVVVSGGKLSVIFERPNFDARFFSAANAEVTAERVEIDITRTGSSDVRTVEITRTGQIIVQSD